MPDFQPVRPAVLTRPWPGFASQPARLVCGRLNASKHHGYIDLINQIVRFSRRSMIARFELGLQGRMLCRCWAAGGDGQSAEPVSWVLDEMSAGVVDCLSALATKATQFTLGALKVERP